MNNDTVLKLSIGGIMGVAESLFGGNMFESLKIMRQHNNKYIDSVKILYARNGIRSLLYTGYYPYGIFQSISKGVPFFYASITTKEYLEKKNLSKDLVSIGSGFSGGFAQGFFIAPTQRLKTLSIINNNPNHNLYEILKKEKINDFFY